MDVILLKIYLYRIITEIYKMNRDRPLQHSMLLPDNSSRRQSFEYTGPQNVLKKSSTFNHNGQTQFQPYFVSPNHMANIGNSPRPLRRQSVENKVEAALGQLNQKVEKMSKVLDRHQFQINSQLNGVNKADQLTKTVLNQVRQALPSFSSNNDVYEHIFNLKLDIKDMQDKLSKCVKENDFKKLQILVQDSASQKSKKINENKLNEVSTDLLKKRDEYFQNLLNGMEGQISSLKKNLQNGSLDLKVSPISSNSLIILKYQELFKAKKKEESDIVINEYIYYIDNEGYLLDANSRYIVDQKGKKVRLEEKHIQMLRNQKILL